MSPAVPVCSDTMDGLPKIRPSVDERWAWVVAGGADQTGALLHQALDLVTGEPLAVVHVFRVVCGQGADGVHHLLVSGLAHKEEGGLLPYLGRQQADGLAEDIVALAALKGAHRGKQRAAAVVARSVWTKFSAA